MAIEQINSAHAKASQDFVPIEQVRDGIVILKDGSYRAILMTSSLNIALKSQDEQIAILAQFQNFLNSLDFSIQMFIQSRELDIRPYLSVLEQRYTEQTSELMRIQVREYIDFIKGFTEDTDIMTKGFFIVVPYTPSGLSRSSASEGPLAALFGGKKKHAADNSMSKSFEENRSQLEQRINVVLTGLSRTGVRAVQLGTEEVIELFYKMFNIGELDRPMPIGVQDLANSGAKK